MLVVSVLTSFASISGQSQEIAEQYLLWSDNLSGHILVLISCSAIKYTIGHFEVASIHGWPHMGGLIFRGPD